MWISAIRFVSFNHRTEVAYSVASANYYTTFTICCVRCYFRLLAFVFECRHILRIASQNVLSLLSDVKWNFFGIPFYVLRSVNVTFVEVWIMEEWVRSKKIYFKWNFRLFTKRHNYIFLHYLHFLCRFVQRISFL